MKTIQLTKEQVTIVDDDDYEILSKWKWWAQESVDGKSYYAIRRPRIKGESRKRIWMHRVIMNAPDNMYVDHINHNTLDNRKENLRLATTQENAMNMISHRNTYGYKGIQKHGNKYMAKITINQKLLYIGLYKTKKEAALAYDKEARKYFGEFACLNFPNKGETGNGLVE